MKPFKCAVKFNLCVFAFVNLLVCYPALAGTYARSIPITCHDHLAPSAAFNQRFTDFIERWQVPGASLAIMSHGKMRVSCGYGWADMEAHQAVQPDALFRLGSVSKTVTAIAVLQLIQEGKLKFNDKVFNVLNDLKPLSHAAINPELYQITVRNLLQMSSGWYVDRPQDFDPLLGPWSNTMLKQLKNVIPPNCETASRLMMDMPLQFTPGTQWSYSNVNYCLLGMIINKLSGQIGAQGYESYIQQRLLKPYGVTGMQLGQSNFENRSPREVKYYFHKDPNLFVDIDRSIVGLPYGDTDILKKNYSDGGWIASASDLVKMLQAFSNKKLINENMIKEMIAKPAFTKIKNSYSAMGWDEVNYRNNRYFLVKTGSFTGTKAFIMLSEQGDSYAVLFNAKPAPHKQFVKELESLLLNNEITL